MASPVCSVPWWGWQEGRAQLDSRVEGLRAGSLVWISYTATQGSQSERARGPSGSHKASYDLDSESRNVPFTTSYQASGLLSVTQIQKEEN